MARPRQIIRRDWQLNLALTEREFVTVRERARRAGMKAVDYARALLLGDAQERATAAHNQSADERLIYEQLKRLGNNLNQIARMQNTLRVPAPPTLDPLLRKIREMIDRTARRDY